MSFRYAAGLLVLGLVGACGVEQRFGASGGGGAPEADGGARGAASDADAGAARGEDAGPAIGSDASAPPALTPCPTGRLCWADPLPTGDDFTSVWASAQDDVWLLTRTGSIVRWDGQSARIVYQAMDTVSDQVTGAAIWGVSRNDVWFLFNVARPLDPGSRTQKGVHWDGATFTEADVLADGIVAASGMQFAGEFRGVAISPTGFLSVFSQGGWNSVGSALPSTVPVADVFAFGDSACFTVWSVQEDGQLSRLESGSPWKSEPGALPSGGRTRGVGIWGASFTDVWQVVETCTGAKDAETAVIEFRHYDGTTWQVAQSEPTFTYGACDAEVQRLHGKRVSGQNSSDIWATVCTDDDWLDACLWHWDGARWSKMPGVATTAIHAAGSSVWAAGTRGSMNQWDGSNWKTRLVGANYATITAISSARNGDVFAVKAGVDDVSVLRFDGTSFQPLPPFAQGGLPRFAAGWIQEQIVSFDANDVWMIAALDRTGAARAYPDGEFLVRWDGSSWRETGVGGATALWGDTPSDVWVATGPVDGLSEPAEVKRWDGSTWLALSVPEQVVSISGNGPSDVWLLGASHLFHWDGTGFTQMDGPPGFFTQELVFHSVLAAGQGDTWIVPARQTHDGDHVWHMSGASWKRVETPFFVRDAWASSPNDVWFVGGWSSPGQTLPARSALAHWDGRSIAQDVRLTVGPQLLAISGAGPNDMWVGGWDGAILRTSLDANAPTTH